VGSKAPISLISSAAAPSIDQLAASPPDPPSRSGQPHQPPASPRPHCQTCPVASARTSRQAKARDTGRTQDLARKGEGDDEEEREEPIRTKPKSPPSWIPSESSKKQSQTPVVNSSSWLTDYSNTHPSTRPSVPLQIPILWRLTAPESVARMPQPAARDAAASMPRPQAGSIACYALGWWLVVDGGMVMVMMMDRFFPLPQSFFCDLPLP